MLTATGAITDNRELIRKPGFPSAILPVVCVTSQLVHFVLALPILVLILLLDGVQPGAAVLAIPLIVALQFCLTLGVSYVAASSQVRFRDTQHLLTIGLMLAFYVTPIFYRVEQLPEHLQGPAMLNPLAIIVASARDVVVYGRVPNMTHLGLTTVISLATMQLGYAWFMKSKRGFADVL